MNNNILQKLFTLIVIVVVIVLFASSCSLNESKKGYHIDHQIREDIWKLTSDAGVLLIKNEFNDFSNMFSDTAIFDNDTNDSKEFLYMLKDILLKSDFYSQNAYYQKNILGKQWVKVEFEDPEIKPFNLKYKPKTKETAITISILENGDSQRCLTTIFGKYLGSWKIDYFFIGRLTIENKDAYDWLKEAESWIEQNDYVMANHCIQICDWLLKPAEDIWKYKNENEILDASQNLNRLIRRNLKLPHYINKIASKPRILELYPATSFELVYPAVTYFSNILLSDSIAIYEECSALDGIFGEYYRNINSQFIFVKIVDDYDPYTEPENFIVIKRKLFRDTKINIAYDLAN